MKWFLLTLCSFLTLTLSAHDHGKPAQANPDLGKLTFYEKRLQKNPEDLVALSELGRISLDIAHGSGGHGYFQTAEGYFRQALAIDPDNLRGLLGLGYALIGNHGFHEGLKVARHAAEVYPEEAQAWALLGDIHFALGHYVDAEMCFQRLFQQSANFAAQVRLAQVHQVRGRFEEAMTLFKAALDQVTADPKAHAWCLTMIGDLQLEMGNVVEARRNFEAARPFAADYAEWRLSEIAWQAGPSQAAIHDAVHLHKRRPDVDAYSLSLARMYAQKGALAKAEALWQATEQDILAEVNRGDLGHIRPLIQSWLEREIHLEQALALAERELKEVRGDLEAHELVGWALYQQGRVAEAVPYFDQALRPGLGTTRTLLRGAIVYYHSGAKMKAAQLLQLGLERGCPLDRSLQQEAARLLCELQTERHQLTVDWLHSQANASTN